MPEDENHIFKDVGRNGTTVQWKCSCDGKIRVTDGASLVEARSLARYDWSQHVSSVRRNANR